MTLHVGLDVSQKLTAICAVDDTGRRLWRGQCSSDPEQIERAIRRHAGDDARIGIETMDTPAACRTYNVLLAEGRSVVAALLFESDSAPAA